MATPLPFPYERAAWDLILDDLADRIASRIAERVEAERSSRTPLTVGADELLTAREACSRLSISRSSLDRLTRRGALRMVKVGARNRYPRSSLDGYVLSADASAA